MSKKIAFDYKGGTYTQQISIRGTNLPWTYTCDSDWLKVETGATSITMTAPITYDFHTREAHIILYDKFKNQLEIDVEQTGYYNLNVECSDSLVLYHSYYDMNNSFDFYITVYGGPTQQIKCTKLKNKFITVWDNSDMYNDFILRVPESLSGKYKIEHSDAKDFIKYCKQNKIEYDASKLSKEINIVQVSTDDVIGQIKVTIDGKEYKSGDKCCVEVNDTDWIDINIDSTSYIHVDSNTKYSVIDDRIVDCQMMANWLDYKNTTGLVKIKAAERNPFGDRNTQLRLVNRTNAHQYLDILITQKGSTTD